MDMGQASRDERIAFLRKAVAGLVKLPLLPLTLFRALRAPPPLRDGGSVPPVMRDAVFRHVKFLTSLDRSFLHVDEQRRAADYIAAEFAHLGIPSERQTFASPHGETENVIGRIGPAESAALVIGAHYDVCVTEVPDGTRKPGADDNASAVAALLELARMLIEENPALPYRVELVAYANEEPPYFRTRFMGSAVHARSLAERGANVRGMVALDMLGYFSTAPGSQRFPLVLRPFLPTIGDFIAVVGEYESLGFIRTMKTAVASHSTVPAHMIVGPSFIPGLDYSDHLNYSALGWPAAMLTDTAFYRNPNYHRRTDTIETLDFGRLAEVVRGIYGLVAYCP
jgi:Zn-dependent M28 family amino/carboxypeptidase